MKLKETDEYLRKTLSSKKPDESVIADARLNMPAKAPFSTKLLRVVLSASASVAALSVAIVAFVFFTGMFNRKQGGARFMDNAAAVSASETTKKEGTEHGEATPEDFCFTIRWGVYGQSYYNSDKGTLIKTNATVLRDPDEYKTTLLLSSDKLASVYAAFYEINVWSYPDEYDPTSDVDSSPCEVIELSFTANGKTKTIACPRVAMGYDGADESARAFIAAVRETTDIITASAEWQALPEYEVLYY